MVSVTCIWPYVGKLADTRHAEHAGIQTKTAALCYGLAVSTGMVSAALDHRGHGGRQKMLVLSCNSPVIPSLWGWKSRIQETPYLFCSATTSPQNPSWHVCHLPYIHWNQCSRYNWHLQVYPYMLALTSFITVLDDVLNAALHSNSSGGTGPQPWATCRVQAQSEAVSRGLEELSLFFMEVHDVTRPEQLLKTIKDFMTLFRKTLVEVQVCLHHHLTSMTCYTISSLLPESIWCPCFTSWLAPGFGVLHFQGVVLSILLTNLCAFDIAKVNVYCRCGLWWQVCWYQTFL